MPRATKSMMIPACAAALGVAMLAGWMISPVHAAQRRTAEASIAVCAVPDIMNDLMESDRFAPELQRYIDDQRTELEPLVERLQQLQQQLQGISQDDPQAPALFQEFQRLRQEAATKQNEVNIKIEQFRAKQIIEAYKLVRSSSQAIAEDLGFEYVITSSDDAEDLEPQNVESALRQIMSRPAIMFPDDSDITDDVREDLNLE